MIVIIGGGVIGLSIGWQLAKSGVDVTLMEEDVCGRDASWASAGMLAPHVHTNPESPGITERNRLLLALEQDSHRLWEGYRKELQQVSGIDLGYRPGGSLQVSQDAAEEQELLSEYELQKSLGLDIEWLSAREARDIEPGLSPNLTGATFSPRDGQVEPRNVVRALREAFLVSGGKLREHTPVRAVEVSGGQVHGVRTDDGIVESERVVLAAGAWSAQIEGIPPSARPPVHPAKGQMMALKMDPRHLSLEHIVFRKEGYNIPRLDGRLVVGATFEEVGFDTTITVEGMLHLMRRVTETLPATGKLQILEMWAGLRPRSADDAPVLGPTEIHGLELATGHFHIGIILSPITAKYMSEYLMTDRLPEPLRPFTIERFRRVDP